MYRYPKIERVLAGGENYDDRAQSVLSCNFIQSSEKLALAGAKPREDI
jgi:hypothetical protein